MAQNKTDKKTEEHKRISFNEFINVSLWVVKMQLSVDKTTSIIYIIFKVIEGLTPIGYTYISSMLMDQIIELAQTKGSLSVIYPSLGVLFGFSLAQSLIGSVRNYTYWMLQPQMRPNMRKAIYEKLVALGIQTLEDPEITNKINRIENSLGDIMNYFRQIVQVLTYFVSFTVSLILVAINFPILVPVVLLAAIPAVLHDKKYRTIAWDFSYKNTEASRKAYANSYDLTSPQSLQEIIVINGKKFLDKKFMKYSLWYVKELSQIHKKWFVGYDVLNVLNDLAYYFGYVLVLSRLLVGKITVGGVYFNIRLIERLGREFDNFTGMLNNLYEYSLRFKDAKELFSRDPAFPDGSIVLPTMEKGPVIEVKDMNFAYPRAKKNVIENMHLKIESGEKIAIVGHNGAGKTTLAKLLARMYLPNSGTVFINGVDVKDIKADSLYDNMSVLFQEYNTYAQLTAEENVWIGRPNEQKNEEAIIEALKKADAWDFVQAFPDGLNQILSERYKGGIRPSTGQWQKIAIARFFYRNAPFVIFDEPTAAIDAVSEYNIFNKIYEFFEGKTVIIISHRFSTVRNADRILVFENGKIIEQGSHQDLMDMDGYYAKSFKLQAEGYNN